MTVAELVELLAIEDPLLRALEGQRRHGRSWTRQAEDLLDELEAL